MLPGGKVRAALPHGDLSAYLGAEIRRETLLYQQQRFSLTHVLCVWRFSTSLIGVKIASVRTASYRWQHLFAPANFMFARHHVFGQPELEGWHPTPIAFWLHIG